MKTERLTLHLNIEDGLYLVDAATQLIVGSTVDGEFTDAENQYHAEIIWRAVNSHDALLEAAKDALAVIKRLADEEGRFFDDRDMEMGLEGKLEQAIKLG